MIALLIAAILHWTPPPCAPLAANYYAPTDAYWLSGDFLGRTDGARLWSTVPISATAVYSDTTDVATISLYESLALRDHDGALQTQNSYPYTVYLCPAGVRPRVLWMPMAQT